MNYPLRRKQPSLSLTETFLRLAQMTTPHGYEPYCWPCLPLSENDHFIDGENNVHIWVKTKAKKFSRVMWSSHLDSACRDAENVTFRSTKDRKITTNGKTILSADCKIGAAIMIKMIEARIPGWYIFHAGEERGGIGSRYNMDKKWPCEPAMAIALDRNGYSDVITHQGGERTCSQTWALAFAKLLNYNAGKSLFAYKPCDTGSFTDTKNYCKRVPECTNLSVGYFNAHCTTEMQDMLHAEWLMYALIDNAPLIEDMAVARDPSKYESKWAQSTYTPPNGGYSHRQTKKERKAAKKAERQKNGTTAESGTGKQTYYPVQRDEEKAYKAWWQSKGYTTEAEAVVDGATPPNHVLDMRRFRCPTCTNTCSALIDDASVFCHMCGGSMQEVMDISVDSPKPGEEMIMESFCHDCKKVTASMLQCEHCRSFMVTRGPARFPRMTPPLPVSDDMQKLASSVKRYDAHGKAITDSPPKATRKLLPALPEAENAVSVDALKRGTVRTLNGMRVRRHHIPFGEGGL